MKRALTLLLLSIVAPSAAYAVDADDCRKLLTIDEVASAVGGAAELTSASKRGEVDPGSVEESSRLQVCSWASTSLLGGGVNIDVVPSVEPAAMKHALDVVAFPLVERREQHWTEDRQDFGGVRCSSLSPPEPTAQRHVTGCVGEVRGAALYVGVVGLMDRPTYDLVKRLFDEAAARL